MRRQRKKPATRAASRPTPSPTPSPTPRATLFVDPPPDFGAVVADAKVVGTVSTGVALADELGTVEVADGVDV